jgi:hypothetical protein
VSPCTGEYLELPEEHQKTVDAGIKAEAALHNLAELVDGTLSCYFKKNQQQTVIDSSRTNNNDRFFRPLWEFFAKTGNYGSMIMLLYPRKRNARLAGHVPAMEPEALASYIRFKKNQKGVILRDGGTDTNVPILSVSVLGVPPSPVECTGTWKANHTMKTFRSLLKNVHQVHGHTGPFQHRCDNCVAVDGACMACHPDANLRRKGNPTDTATFAAVVKGCYDRTYVSKGCSNLYPFEVRKLRTALLTPGQDLPTFISNLGFYVLMLLSITQIMRTDESHNLTFQSFDSQSAFFVEDRDKVIQHLAFQFIGKADKTMIYHFINSDHLQPEFDPVRHLLLYVFLLQKLLVDRLPTGFLFMPPESLRPRATGQTRGGLPRNGFFSECISMSSLRTSLKNLLSNVLGLSVDTMKVGLHMFRKTGYAFRLWAHGLMDKTAAMTHSAWALLKHDARHVNDANAMNYAQCAWSLVRFMTTFDDPRNCVSQTKPIRFMSSGHRGHVLNLSKIKGMSLNEVASHFVEGQLCQQHAQYTSHYDLFQRLFDPSLVSNYQ